MASKLGIYLKEQSRRFAFNAVKYCVKTATREAMDFVVGGVATAGAAVILNPLEVMRPRIDQSNPPVKIPKNLTHTMYNIVKAEGVAVLQKGILTSVMMQFVNSVGRNL